MCKKRDREKERMCKKRERMKECVRGEKERENRERERKNLK